MSDADAVRYGASAFLTSRSQRQTTPWLNGQGSTQVVLATDAWRISVADEPLVSTFSTFRGYDRVIIPIGRTSLHLEEPPRDAEAATRPSTSKVVRPLTSFAFPGEWAPMCRTSARTRALNVMTKRGEATVAIRMAEPNPPAVSNTLRIFFDVETEVALMVPPGAQHEPVQPGRYVIITITKPDEALKQRTHPCRLAVSAQTAACHVKSQEMIDALYSGHA